jgi:hypothetical protein
MPIQRLINSKSEFRASDLSNYRHRHSQIPLTCKDQVLNYGIKLN